MIIPISLFYAIILLLCSFIAGITIGIAISILNYQYNYKCDWSITKIDLDYYYKTKCNKNYFFIKKIVKNANIIYCPFCGRKINEKRK